MTASVRRDALTEAVEAIARAVPYNAELNPYTGVEDPHMAAFVEGVHHAHDIVAALRDATPAEGES